MSMSLKAHQMPKACLQSHLPGMQVTLLAMHCKGTSHCVAPRFNSLKTTLHFGFCVSHFADGMFAVSKTYHYV